MNIVEAANKARQTPGFIYHPETAEKLTRPTPTVPKMGTIPLKIKITGIDKYKVKKSPNPDMGSYDAMQSYKKTQLTERTSLMKNMAPRKTFTEI